MDSIIRGQYQPLEKLGSGGMGDVVKAKDLKLNRLVALKFLRADHSGDPDRRRRFMQEAQAASALNHPNIITIHDVVTTDEGADIMVMELVAGRSLDALIPTGGLRMSQVITYSAQIADALAAAHGAGIVHRDLKPGNIMVTERDLVKLLDFGLAKLATGAFDSDPDATKSAPLTVQGTIVGTLSYMSPEQAQGKTADARSDIFSLGAVLYEMATGLRAFTGDNAISTLTSVLRDEPRRVLEISPETPALLSEVIHRCLEKDPDRRFQSMAEVRDTLVRLRQQSDSGGVTTKITPPAGHDATTIIRPPQRTPVTHAAPPTSNQGLPAWTWPAVGLTAALVVAGAWWGLADTDPVPTPEPEVAQADALPDMPTVPDPTVETPGPPPAGSSTNGTQRASSSVAPGTAAPRPRTAPTPAAAVITVVTVPDAHPLPLELQTDIPLDAEAGFAVQFLVTADVAIDGHVVIAKGAVAMGEVHADARRRRRVNVKLTSVTAVDGATLAIRATAAPGANSNRPIEMRDQTSEEVSVSKGATTIGYTSGTQPVSVKQ